MDDEEESHTKKKRRSLRLSKKDRQRVNNYFTEYCNSTSIHGFQYLGEQKRSCIEKLWWFISIMISACILVTLIWETYEKWNRSPVFVSFATKQTPIMQIPFPAVTICPEIKSRQTVFNFTKLYGKKFSTLNEDEKKKYAYLSLICKVRSDGGNLTQRTVAEEVLDFFDNVSPGFNNMSLKCTWMRETYNCETMFTPIMTDVGVCYTFNMLKWDELFRPETKRFKNYLQHSNSSGWELDAGYGNDEALHTYPRRALYAGATNGLQITMVTYKKDMDYICGDSLQGYKVLLHHPAEIPRVSQKYFRLPLDQAVIAAIKPDIMTTSHDLSEYPSEKRQCLQPKEHPLQFFKIYTQQNCEIECLANFTKKSCDCVDFYMPRVEGTPICGPGSKTCMQVSEDALLFNELAQQLEELKSKELKRSNDTLEVVFRNIQRMIRTFHLKSENSVRNGNSCNCLPACTSLGYTAETSQSDYDWVENLRGLHDSYGFLAENYVNGKKKAHLSKLLLFFKDSQFIASERNEMYNLTSFLAACGGLLSLFTGFSIISLMEIIYFLTLRWMCNITYLRWKRRARR